jgi:hypothetical protein
LGGPVVRLGEALIKEGLITDNVLVRALERQVIFGGRLGTNLVEMGAISEENLAKFLGKLFGVPYAGPEQFEAVPQEVLDAFPAEMARKYTAFPIRKERSRLHLAMTDPNDIAVLDELRFILGLDVRGCIASEIRIQYALEKYYDIKRDLRFIPVPDEERAFEAPSAPPEAARVEEVSDEAQAQVQPVPVTQAVGPAQPAPEATAEEAPALPGPVIKAPGPARAEPVHTQSGTGDPYLSLASPANREEIAQAIVTAAKADLARAALFMVKGSSVTCWKVSGDAEAAGEVSFTLDAPGIFKDVVEDGRFYKGPVLDVPQNRTLLDMLGGEAPLEAIAFPLIIKGKVVGVLYGDDGEGSMLRTDIRRLGSLMSKASMSLEILILKNKILADA